MKTPSCLEKLLNKQKVKAKYKLIKPWWFEIKLASQKIAVMEEVKIDELVYNDVVDILN